ncbi:MAG TPA: hypothetical protein VKB38_20310 [Terracidiphilus sp.]|nr:hypothetical protein [Terracidiphilus sp.]
MKFRALPPVLAALSLPLAAGCRSKHVEFTVENRTGADIQLLEVDYPSASFGADRLASGASMHYRVQLIGSGPVKVQFAAGNRGLPAITGPTLSEDQQGALDIVLLPDDKAEFHPSLSPAR